MTEYKIVLEEKLNITDRRQKNHKKGVTCKACGGKYTMYKFPLLYNPDSISGGRKYRYKGFCCTECHNRYMSAINGYPVWQIDFENELERMIHHKIINGIVVQFPEEWMECEE